MAQQNPAQIPTIENWHELRSLVEREIPDFRMVLNPDKDHPLSDFDYDVCLLIRIQLSPIEMSKLKQCTPAYITKTRKKLLKQVFNIVDTAEVFDEIIMKIRKKSHKNPFTPNS